MTLQWLQTVPIFRIFDVPKAKEFYVGFLGFRIDWEHRYEPTLPLYMQVTLGGEGGFVLHLSEHYGDGSPGATAFIRVKGLKTYHAEIMAKGYNYLRPGLQETGHNSMGLNLTDPFGNHLRLDEAMEKS
jgi:catechol 2,3-dioxygenase-like lactoylglutathione lyase family enzyme